MSSSTVLQGSINNTDPSHYEPLSPPAQAHLASGRVGSSNVSSGHVIASGDSYVPDEISQNVRTHALGNTTSPSTQHSNAELQAMAARALATLPPTTPPNPRPPPQPYHNRSQAVRFMAYMGVGRNATRERKALVAVLQNIGWGLIQMSVVVTLLVLTGTFFRSPLDSNLTEWVACDRPLGIWASLWVVRAFLATVLSYWEYQRDKLRITRRSDTESPGGGDGRNPPDAPTAPVTGGFNNFGAPTGAADLPSMSTTEPIVFPFNRLYQRLTILSSLLTLTWFLTAHIFVYTSINTCRTAAPHLWWLTFGILCTLYLMVVEVLILGLVVLLIAPIFIFFYNIILMCLGRHPIQRPHELKPDIPKLSKSIVDKIPLVVYIPPPNEEQTADTEVHSYPPSSSPSASPAQKRTFFRSLSSFKKSQEKGEKGSKGKKSSWEDNWEQTEYPFVTLTGNRATCAICLMDFEEPERKKLEGDSEKGPQKETDKSNSTDSPTGVTSGQTSPQSPSGDDMPRLEDAGEGVQPLRLLECGHVFHKTCLDPWLLDVSGRCPTCQRPVDKTKTRGQPTSP